MYVIANAEGGVPLLLFQKRSPITHMPKKTLVRLHQHQCKKISFIFSTDKKEWIKNYTTVKKVINHLEPLKNLNKGKIC